jgi:hypothetical protein
MSDNLPDLGVSRWPAPADAAAVAGPDTALVPEARLLFNRQEAAGALGDLGVFIPLLVGMVTQCGLQLGPALLFAGVMNVITGYWSAIPLVIQPMKAIAAVAIAEHLSEAEIIAAGIITGAAVLLLLLVGLIDRLCAIIPRSVVRGLQLALGLKLIYSGFWMVAGTGTFWGGNGIALGLACLAIAVFLGQSARFPAALAIFLIGLAALAASGFGQATLSPALPAWHIPNLWDTAVWLDGFRDCAIPQIPLTLLNSVLAVSVLSTDLFPKRAASPRKIALSVALMNLLCCPLGAMPMCHGAGGLAAQHRFGARSGGSLIMLGAVMILLGLSSGGILLAAMQHYPSAALGVLLGCGGFELALVCRDQTAWREMLLMLVTAIVCCAGNIATGFLIGCVLYIALRWPSLFRARRAGH